MPRFDQLTFKASQRPVESTDNEDAARRRGMFLDQCELLLDDERWQFAWDTVGSMRDKVRDGFQPTEAMWRAVKNIEAGGRRQAAGAKRWGRRYEGR